MGKVIIAKFSQVSNPWREAIEDCLAALFMKTNRKFPILGGRLLKSNFYGTSKSKDVSFQSLEGGY